MSIEAMKQALEALDTAYYQTCSVGRQKDWHQITKAMTTLRTAIEQAEKQEPVAWMDGYRNIYSLEEKAAGCEDAVIPLVPAIQHWSDCAVHNEPAYPKGDCDCGGYTTPPAAPVQGLEKGCHRSHPHENMDAMCELRTEIARLTNEKARLKAAQRQWVGLTDAEILEVLCIWPDADDDPDDYMEDIREARAIEAKLREKNGAGQRLWIGLTQEQRNEIVFNAADEESATYQTEDKLRELNEGTPK